MGKGAVKADKKAKKEPDVNWFLDVMSKILLTVSAIFLCLGVGMMGSGITMLGNGQDVEDNVELLNNLPLVPASYVVTFLGVMIIVVSAVGVYGGYQKNRFYLTMFLFFNLSIFVLLLVNSIYILTYDDDNTLDTVVKDFWFEEGIDARQRRIAYQNYFDCCGWVSNTDSLASGYSTPCTRGGPSACREATQKWLGENFTPTALFGVVFASLQGVGLLSLLIYLCTRKEEDEEELLRW